MFLFSDRIRMASSRTANKPTKEENELQIYQKKKTSNKILIYVRDI